MVVLELRNSLEKGFKSQPIYDKLYGEADEAYRQADMVNTKKATELEVP